MRPIKPFKLVPGDRIGIVAPASTFKRQGLERGIEKLRWWGFDPIVPDTVLEHAKKPSDRGRSRRYEEKAEEIIRMFRDPTVSAIFCAEAGYGSIAVIPHLEKVDLSMHPKIFVGFSDITLLLLHFHMRYNWVTFHGPTVSQEIFKGMPPVTELALQEAITRDTKPGDVYGRDLEVIVPGQASGRIIGGNLSRMLQTLGTPFEIDTRDHILFIEEVDEGHIQIDGNLNHLKLAGKLDRIRGVVFSEMVRCMGGDRRALLRYLRRFFRGAEYPVFLGLPLGHSIENITLPIGVRVKLCEDPPRFLILEAGVR